MGRMKNAPQKKYARHFESVRENKLKHYIRNGSKGCVPKARTASGQAKVPVI